MKTKEELNALKNEVEALNKKLAELTEEELAQVTGDYECESDSIEPGVIKPEPGHEWWRYNLDK